MSLELQKIDCNCNDCKFMERDFVLYESFSPLYGQDKKASHRINYGTCANPDSGVFNQTVKFIPNVCQLHTQHCFTHRRK